MYTVLKNYLKTTLIGENQKRLHSTKRQEIHILPALTLEPQQETQITNRCPKITNQ